MFGCLLGLRSFDSLEGLLARKQASVPITFDGVEFVSTSTVAPTTYLGSWALVISIIAVRFMVDQHPFLFEALARVNNNTFPFQHLKATCDLLPPLVGTCFLPFEQFIMQQMIRFQNSISELLHHYTLFNMLFDETFEAHCA
jgi:hypothetical protein